MRYKIALLLSATAFLSGCVAEPALQASDEGTPTSPQPTTASERENISASPSAERDRDERLSPAVPIEETAKPRTLETKPVVMEGRTATRLCYGGPFYSALNGQRCRDLQPSDDTTMALDLPRMPAYLNGTLTWDADAPANDRLYTYLLVHDGEYYRYIESRTVTIGGSSPLQVSFDLSEYAGQKLGLGVSNMACVGTPMCAAGYVVTYGLSQEFSFKGELSGWE